ncbi:MAG TPA: NF038122 family metalloprotease [Thermoanaerobaculia bacterium]
MRSFVVFCSLLLSFTAFGAELASAAQFEPIHDHGAFIVRNVGGKLVCHDATPAEARRLNAPSRVQLTVFGEESGRIRTNASAGLNIILRGTTQLDANPAAKAAFERAAEIWESKIADPVTVYVDVDFGSTRFGEPFDENVIASANSDYRGAGDGLYAEVRALMLAHAHNANETAVYGALPLASLPTDIGGTTGLASPSILLRAIGAIDAVALPGDEGPDIGFNSAFPYDFDPANGISPGQTDFEGVVVHEIGHMLGFVSRVGSQELGSTINAPSLFDWFRFRPGVTLGTFGSAQRIQASGGTQVYFTGTSSLALSTGRPDGTGGDENQASHWKDDALTGVRIGVMDPTLSKGVRSQLTDADLQAFGMMGFNIVSGTTPGGQVPATPSNLSATGTSTTVIRLNWTDNSNNETEFRIEQKVGATFQDIGSAAANATQINVTGFAAGQSATFRVRARNTVGDSGYSNEASGTTLSTPGTCTPNDTTVCLLNGRFRVKIDYVNPFSNPPNQPGTFRAARLLDGAQNPDTALFGFSSAQAVEVVVRLQDTRPFANRFDVYYGGMTDVGYTVTVTDTQTGVTKQYTNQVGKVGGGVDRNTFPTSALGEEDRMLTSGGYGSFPAEKEELKAGDLRGIKYVPQAILGTGLSKKPVRMMAPATAAVASELEQSNAKALNRLSAGGGGACAEVEPNDTTLVSDTLPLGTPCTGTANFGDSYTYVIDYDSGDEGRVHDVFEIVTGAAGPITVTLTFTSASADLDVVLFRQSGSTLTILDGAAGSTTTETFTTDSLAAGTYYIGVSAFAGGSPYTLTATGTSGGSVPAAPSNLAATGTSTSVIRLTWNDNSNNETEFRVEQKVGSVFTDIGAASANATAINVTNFQPNSTATFRVRARNASGDSGYSNEATGTTQGGGPTTCTPSDTVVCLLSNRFRVKIDYINPFSNPPNQPGTFRAARLLQGVQNPDTGLFGFSSAQAVEVVVRVQDTRPFANRFDIYYGGMTDVGYTVTVTDTATGTTRQYTNTVGTVGGGVDRNSFPTN